MKEFLKAIFSFFLKPKELKIEAQKPIELPKVEVPVEPIKAVPVELPKVEEPIKEEPKKEDPIFNIPKPFLNFPDISRYEACDFNLFKANDMITKATEGTNVIDPTLFFNIKGCRVKGIRLGVYHFYRVGRDPIEQAKFFIKTVGLENLKAFYYEPVVDFETSTVGVKQTEADMKKAIPQLQIFMDYVEKETGRAPMFYSYESLIRYLELPKTFSKYRLWIARYGKEPTDYLPWKQYWAWQYSDGEIKSPMYNDNFEGIGRCDSNIFWSK